MPFTKSTARLLCDLFPLRLESCVVFPVPQLAHAFWRAVKPFVGTNTREKVCLVMGSAWKNSVAPERLGEYLDGGLVADFEERRKSCFS